MITGRDTLQEINDHVLQAQSQIENSDREMGNLTSHLEVSPDGRFVCGSNRGHDSIVTFRVMPESGALELVSHTHGGGKSPRAFAIHPSGKWLLVANEASGNVVVFSRDLESGLLTQTAAEQGEMPTCMCLVFVPQVESLAAAAL